MQALSNGKHEIVYHFSDGTTDTFILTVINSAVTDDVTVDNVTNFTSTNATDSSLTLAWNKNSKADGYSVEIYILHRKRPQGFLDLYLPHKSIQGFGRYNIFQRLCKTCR